MAEKIDKVLHKRSNQLVEDAPKLPTSEQLEYGEIAINYASGKETISIKNANNEIATFSSDKIIDKKLDAKADKTAISDMLTKTEASSTYAKASHTHTASQVTDLQGKLEAKADKTAISDMLTKTEASSTYATKEELPDEYVLPIASSDLLGGIKIGAGLSINSETGVVSATGGGVADSVDWNNITSKPETFKPETHQHVSADVTDLQGKLDAKADKTAISDMLTKTEASSTYAKASHTHTASQVTDLQGKLDAKADKTAISDMLTKTEASSTYAKTSHTHILSEIMDFGQYWNETLSIDLGTRWGRSFQVDLGENWDLIFGKDINTEWQSVLQSAPNFAAASHTHTASQVTDLQDKLDTKADKTAISDMLTKTEASSTYAKASHTHTASQVTDLQDKLDAKADKSHEHTVNQISNLGEYWEASLKQGLGTNWNVPLNSRLGSNWDKVFGTDINEDWVSQLHYSPRKYSKINEGWEQALGSTYSPNHEWTDAVRADLYTGWANILHNAPNFASTLHTHHLSAIDNLGSNWYSLLESEMPDPTHWAKLMGRDMTIAFGTGFDVLDGGAGIRPKLGNGLIFDGSKAIALANTGSDIKYKKNIVDANDVLDDIIDLPIIEYTWNKEGEETYDTFGVDANELLKRNGLLSKMVHEDVNGDKYVEYNRFGVISIKALQEFIKKIEKRINDIEKKIN